MSPKPSVLIADDSESIRNLYSRFLDKAGYRTLTASGANEALGLVRQERPSLALIDLFMDGRDIGFDLCLALSKSGVDVVLMSSVLTDERDRLKAFQAGAIFFLEKPGEPSHIARHVQRFLEEPRPFLQLAQTSTRGAVVNVAEEASPVLVVDDDEAMAQAASLALEAEGFLPFVAGSWWEAMLTAHKIRPRAVVLDVNLPGVDGIHIMEMLRAHPRTSRVPIIMLTGSEQRGLELQCLRHGADDFVVKGVHDLSALPVRISRLLSAKPVAGTLGSGRLRVDTSARKVWVGRHAIEGLTPKEFDLLTYLVRQSPAVVSWGNIQKDLWNASTENLQPRETRTIAVHCERLRHKLGAAGACIVVHRGIGLQFDPTKLN